jgi:hypothetical protein
MMASCVIFAHKKKKRMFYSAKMFDELLNMIKFWFWPIQVIFKLFNSLLSY